MSTPPTPVPPPRREARRFSIPTPADLRHPGQLRGSEASEDTSEDVEVSAPDGPDEPAASATGAPTASNGAPEPAPPTARAGSPTPATLPRPGHKPGQPVAPQDAPGAGAAEGAGSASAPATAPATAPPAPRTGEEPTTPQVEAPDEADGTDEADQAPSAAATAGDAVRRMIPNPATLMAAGRGMRKVRPPGLRGRRLPKVEETSAGGVVLDLESDPPAVALIARHDRRSRLLWSLPKGHVEEGETPEQAALREVHEETGLLGRIVAPLGVIDFWFVVEDKRIHKTVHHFVIEAVGGELSDEDVEVEAVEWIPFHQVVRKLAYGDERRLVEKVAQIVPGVK